MLDAIRYLVDNGTKWRAVHADFPPWDRVYAFFRHWRNHDLVREFHDRRRRLVRERAARGSEPGAGVTDSQSGQSGRGRRLCASIRAVCGVSLTTVTSVTLDTPRNPSLLSRSCALAYSAQ
ncbi:transposase [Actinacidiphila glaucinigra]|uniref:transposase n=1 Tax=Actinacidiphila glaucinigra TaxID=235986 RepID=UPI0037F31AD3